MYGITDSGQKIIVDPFEKMLYKMSVVELKDAIHYNSYKWHDDSWTEEKWIRAQSNSPLEASISVFYKD